MLNVDCKNENCLTKRVVQTPSFIWKHIHLTPSDENWRLFYFYMEYISIETKLCRSPSRLSSLQKVSLQQPRRLRTVLQQHFLCDNITHIHTFFNNTSMQNLHCCCTSTWDCCMADKDLDTLQLLGNIQIKLEKLPKRLSCIIITLRSAGCKVLWSVRMCVYLNVLNHISKTTCTNFMKFSVHVTRGQPVLWITSPFHIRAAIGL